MCGLVGLISSNMMMKHRDALASLLYLDTWRGRDSTGVAAIRYNGDTSVLKKTVPGYEFIEGPALEQHCKLNDDVWIGHNRYGTIGKNIKSNAHPFMVVDENDGCVLVGAHNGTLKNKHVLPDHDKYGTDSEALFNAIAADGLHDTLAKIEGAWALTYFDHFEDQMNFIRNKERTLFYAFEEGEHTLMWASEAWMLRIVASRHGIKLLDDKVVAFNEDTLYSVPCPEKLNQKLELKKKGGFAGKEAPAFFQNQNWYGRQNGGATSDNRSQSETTQKTPEETKTEVSSKSESGTTTPSSGETETTTKKNTSSENSSNKSGNVVPLQAKLYKGFAGKLITKAELQKQLSQGCYWCEDEEIELTDRYGWLGHGKPVCHKCLDGEHKDQEMVKAIFGQAGTVH